ncbi:hypothetical protein QYE76_057348 [Lolium multiflorum]|uniref:Aminotransferase-like plant mobile domain-containing protein n=1 Tax=Lolium multiflorum TaxID=4521 RepID=A0AAD8WNQ6_LOLMU|nr:hypothetical protein QYE76_057348 [Lolium multiflorum]
MPEFHADGGVSVCVYTLVPRRLCSIRRCLYEDTESGFGTRDSCNEEEITGHSTELNGKLPFWMTWLLDDYYDRQHRAYHIADLGKVLEPFKIRYHGRMRDMPYDERYTEHIEPTGLLPFISLVRWGPPNINAATITALVDRWRPETHTFHLRAGEMTPTLQDVSMIIGLPIQGEPLCMNTPSDGWREQMENLIDMTPLEPPNYKDRAPMGANYNWIRNNFSRCPAEANQDTVRTYTRVWYVISKTLFADSGGKLAQWCWLKALTVLKHKWSWGTTALAYLYHQVDLEPYGSRYHFGTAMGDLNPKCLEEAGFWRCRDGEIATPSPSPPEDEPHDLEIPDDTVLSQAKEKAHAARSAYMLKHRGKGPNRYTPEDYVNRGKKVAVDSNEESPRRSALRRMSNDDPSSSEEEEEARRLPPPCRGVRKQPATGGTSILVS